MASYKLSEDADADLDRLYERGVLIYGLIQADLYYDGLVQRFHELVNGVRSSITGSAPILVLAAAHRTLETTFS